MTNALAPPLAQFRATFFQISTRFFTRTNSTTRRTALELITVLNKNFVDEVDRTTYGKEVETVLLNILLCLADHDDEVKYAAQQVLGSFGKALPDHCSGLIEKHVDNKRLHTGEFTAELCSRIATSLPPDTVIAILTACEEKLSNANGSVRAQTATIIGAMVKSFQDRERLNEIAQRFIAIFIKLLHDESTDTRARAGEALSYLHTF